MSISLSTLAGRAHILIDCLEYKILIAVEENWDGEDMAKYLAGKDSGNLKIMVATHPHADHIGGRDIILDDFSVKKSLSVAQSIPVEPMSPTSLQSKM